MLDRICTHFFFCSNFAVPVASVVCDIHVFIVFSTAESVKGFFFTGRITYSF